MLRGIGVFRDFFRDYQEQYVLIGGAACDLVFEDANIPFRATKDLDLVLMIEALTPAFGRRFWEFIRTGGYENRARSDGSPKLYRFEHPKNPDYPYMIEIFARADSVFADEETGLAPLPLGDDISSLSAILLNQDYYGMLLTGRIILSDIAILPPSYLILFKAKAWLDLSLRRLQGQSVDDRDIRKHRNDIVRLTTLLTGNERLELQTGVKADMSSFIETLEAEPVDPKALGITGLTAQNILRTLKGVYL